MKSKALITALVLGASSVALAHDADRPTPTSSSEHVHGHEQGKRLVARWLPLSSMMTARRRNVIRVPDDRDQLRAIRLVNGTGATYVYSVLLRYSDGHYDRIPVNKWLYPGQAQLTLPVTRGHDLERMDIRAWASPGSTFQTFGQRERVISRPPPPPPPMPTSYVLGTNLTFANTGGTLNLPVGVAKGTFSKLKISSASADTYIGSIRVAFGNGSYQTLAIDRTLRRGEVLDLDLAGNQRAITSLAVMQGRYGHGRNPGRFAITLVR